MSMGDGNTVKRSNAPEGYRSTVPVQGLPVVPEGYRISLYWTEDRALILRVNDTEVQCDPWLGVQLEALYGRSWKRDDITKYEPNELAQYLKKKGG
jgi:hypothetical protein